jgi:hypothetical protein
LIFVFLARTAGIKLSQSIVEGLGSGAERKKSTQKGQIKSRKEGKGGRAHEGTEEPLAENVLARLHLKGTGYVDIKDKDDFEIAKAYWSLLLKKLGLDEDR